MRKLAFLQAPEDRAPKIITAATIRTLDAAGSTAEAILVVGDRIRHLGTIHDGRAAAAPVNGRGSRAAVDRLLGLRRSIRPAAGR